MRCHHPRQQPTNPALDLKVVSRTSSRLPKQHTLPGVQPGIAADVRTAKQCGLVSISACDARVRQRITQDRRCHNEVIAIIPFRTDNGTAIRLPGVVQRHHRGIRNEPSPPIVLDARRRAGKHEAVIANGARITEPRMTRRASECTNPGQGCPSNDPINISDRPIHGTHAGI